MKTPYWKSWLRHLEGNHDNENVVLMQEKGWKKAGDNAVIIISEHNRGTLVDIDLTKSYGIDELIEQIIPLASIA